jgi:hypothetical protein
MLLVAPHEGKSTLEIHFGELLSTLNSLLEFLHQQERVLVQDCDGVDPLIVDAEPKATSVWFWDKEDWQSGQ